MAILLIALVVAVLPALAYVVAPGPERKRVMRAIELIAKSVGWVWAVVAGLGGLVLLVHQGPLPITNGWFAFFSGVASCPLTGSLVKKHSNLAVPIYAQLALALLIFLAGRVAVVVLLHRPFLPQ